MKRKLTKKTKRAIFLYIVILLLLFTIVEVLPKVTDIFETTQVLEPGTLTLSYETKGYFVKTEEIGVAADSGEIEYPVTEGTVVKKGAEVVSIKAVQQQGFGIDAILGLYGSPQGIRWTGRFLQCFNKRSVQSVH